MQLRFGRVPTYYSGPAAAAAAERRSATLVLSGIVLSLMVSLFDAASLAAAATIGSTAATESARFAPAQHAWTVRPWNGYKDHDASAPGNQMMHPEHASIIKDFYSNQNMDSNQHLAFRPPNLISTPTTLPTPPALKWTVVNGAGQSRPAAVHSTTTPIPALPAYDTPDLAATAETRFAAADSAAVTNAPGGDSTRSHIHHHESAGRTRVQTNGAASREAIKSSSPSLSSGQRILTAAATTNASAPFLKSHKTDAPMLNYIFDSHLATNKHHHHDRYGPHFDDARHGVSQMNVTVQIGTAAFLNCRISLLQDKTVSWVKREQENDRLDLLTVGTQTYTGDSRFSVEFQYPNNWRLRIAEANKSDEGLYECQISTYPPRVIKTYFQVRSPEVVIADEHGALLVDKFYEVDSTIQLVCIVRHIAMATSAVYWTHGDRMLNFDMTRGGISVRTDLMDNGANSTLSIAKIRKQDSGNYTCSIGPSDFYTMTLHVLNGESLAELYHGTATKTALIWTLWLLAILPMGIWRTLMQ